MTLYAEQVHARLTIASKEAGAPCSLLATIDPNDMQVSLVMSLCRHSNVSYEEVFRPCDSCKTEK